MFLGAASLAAAALAASTRRKVREEIEALTRRLEEVESHTGAIPRLQLQTDKNTQAIQDTQAAISRMEKGFNLLGERLSTQIEILEALQSSYSDKEEKLQTTLRAVIDAVNDIRRSRAPAGV